MVVGDTRISGRKVSQSVRTEDSARGTLREYANK